MSRWHIWETRIWSSFWNALNRDSSQRPVGTPCLQIQGYSLGQSEYLGGAGLSEGGEINMTPEERLIERDLTPLV